MKNAFRFSLILLVAVLLAIALRAQAPAGQPRPAAGHDKLAYFVGKWACEGETKATSFGPGRKYTATETCEWFAGKFAVVSKADGNLMGGKFNSLSVLSYDSYAKTYVYFETNNWGENVFSRGKMEGDTWTWNNDRNNDTPGAREPSTAVSP